MEQRLSTTLVGSSAKLLVNGEEVPWCAQLTEAALQKSLDQAMASFGAPDTILTQPWAVKTWLHTRNQWVDPSKVDRNEFPKGTVVTLQSGYSEDRTSAVVAKYIIPKRKGRWGEPGFYWVVWSHPTGRKLFVRPGGLQLCDDVAEILRMRAKHEKFRYRNRMVSGS